jgi:hypothetical protein
MKYILLMSGTNVDFESYARWPKQDLQAHAAFMRTLSKELKDEGSFVETVGLGWPTHAKIVRAANDGTPITDGVFPESKELLAGFWIIDVENPEQAHSIAARLSVQPAPGGLTGAPIEVRQIMAAPPQEF